MDKRDLNINENLCQECQDREHNTILTRDPKTGRDLDWPIFLCEVCDQIKMIQNGWIQQENGNWFRPNQ